jgi:hypothetical protein
VSENWVAAGSTTAATFTLNSITVTGLAGAQTYRVVYTNTATGGNIRIQGSNDTGPGVLHPWVQPLQVQVPDPADPEIQARIAEAAQRAQALEEERRAERRARDERARRLLRRHLNSRQRRQFDTGGSFIVQARSGRRYEITNEGPSGNVYLLGQIIQPPREPGQVVEPLGLVRTLRRGHDRVASFCCHPLGRWAQEDIMLTQLLELLDPDRGEERFLEVANMSPYAYTHPENYRLDLAAL